MSELYSRLKSILVILVGVVLLAIPLMFLMENFVRDAIVTPLAYLAWLFGLLIDALPESYLLGLAIAVIVVIAVRSLLRDTPPPSFRNIKPISAEGKATTWLHRLQMVTKGSYSRQRLEHHIGQLLLQIIAYENRVSTREAGRMVEANEVDLSPELMAYLDSALSRRLPKTPNLFERLKSFILGRSTPKSTARTMASELHPILLFLENELKIQLPEERDDTKPTR